MSAASRPAQALLEFAAATPAGSRVLLLVSGGASALLEDPGARRGARRTARAVRPLAGASGSTSSGSTASASRSRRSRAGGCPACSPARAIEALMISDVPRDDPAVLASGLLDDAGPRAAARRLARRRARRRRARGGGARAEGRARYRATRGRRRSGGACAICHELAVGDADLRDPRRRDRRATARTCRPRRPLPAPRGRGGAAASRVIRSSCCSPRARTGATARARMQVRSSTARTVERAADCGIDPGSGARGGGFGPVAGGDRRSRPHRADRHQRRRHRAGAAPAAGAGRAPCRMRA